MTGSFARRIIAPRSRREGEVFGSLSSTKWTGLIVEVVSTSCARSFFWWIAIACTSSLACLVVVVRNKRRW
jgi:hypothetical protein